MNFGRLTFWLHRHSHSYRLRHALLRAERDNQRRTDDQLRGIGGPASGIASRTERDYVERD